MSFLCNSHNKRTIIYRYYLAKKVREYNFNVLTNFGASHLLV